MVVVLAVVAQYNNGRHYCSSNSCIKLKWHVTCQEDSIQHLFGGSASESEQC